MTFRHAGALTISGWLLLLPPTNGKTVTQGAPLEKRTNGAAGEAGGAGEDARPHLGRTLYPRHRAIGAASRRRLARRGLRQAAPAHEGIRRDRALDLGAREAARASG